jgi:hypothetical protein
MERLRDLVRLAFATIALSHAPLLAAAPGGPTEILIVAPPAIVPEVMVKAPNAGEPLRFCPLTIRSAALHDKKLDSGAVQLFLEDRKVPIVNKSIPSLVDKPEGVLPHTVYGTLNDSELDLALPWSPVGWNWPDYHGKVNVRLSIDGTLSETRVVVISAIDSRFWPVACAAAVSLAILALPVALVWSRRKPYAVADRKYNVLSALFLDKETDTYSLSKFQFYAWTAAAVFGYLALTLARSFVQGAFVFAEVPPGLPGLVFISGATTATAQAVNAAKGPKGAGDLYPSLADFVSTGGLVVAERFQFFVWTIVGIAAFLFLIVFDDPATLSNLPRVPPGFLALMGISSMGYLGGKIARKPGPIIDEIVGTVGSLRLSITGRKLSKDASVQIDGREYGKAEADISPAEPDDAQGTETDFFKRLEVSISKPQAEQTTSGRHRVKVINPDAQEAEWFYVLPAVPVVTRVKAETFNTGPGAPGLRLTIEGSGLSKEATFKLQGVALTAANDFKVEGSSPDPAFPVDAKPGIFKQLVVTIQQPAPGWIPTAQTAPIPAASTVEVVNDPQHTSGTFSFYLS